MNQEVKKLLENLSQKMDSKFVPNEDYDEVLRLAEEAVFPLIGKIAVQRKLDRFRIAGIFVYLLMLYITRLCASIPDKNERGATYALLAERTLRILEENFPKEGPPNGSGET